MSGPPCDDCHHDPSDPRVRVICECPCHGSMNAGPRCANDAHDEDPAPDGLRPAATIRLTWPDGRFTPSYACDRCALTCIEIYLLDLEDGMRHPVLAEPIGSITS